VLLLATGALVVQALLRAADNAPGFDPGGMLTAQVRLTEAMLPTDADRTTFVRRMLEEVRATPGVIDAGITLNPFVANGGITTIVRIQDYPRPDGTGYSMQFRRVSTGYFEAMRIRVLDGRTFDDRDVAGTAPVAVISRAVARRFWGDASPIGRRIRRGAPNVWQTVVGVVDDVRDVGLDLEPAPTVYTAYYQANAVNFPVALVVRTAGDPATWEPAIKRAVWNVDASLPLANVRTMGNFLDDTLGRRRFRAALVTVFGVIGALLATIGIYGVTARSVAERTREVGIRIALGGDTRGVWVTMAGASMRAVAAGALAGAVLSALAARGLSALLPEITGPAWIAGAIAAAILAATGAVASMMAARRVLRVEPAQALRSA
jgi:predicted permease